MDYSKIVGWIVFAVGLSIIIWTLVSSYNIFTKQSEVPSFFSQEEQIQELSSGSWEDQIGEMAREEISKLIPVGAISTVLNLGVWSAFSFIFIFGGFQVSTLGIRLIKKSNN
ncbi:MAG: hypothetical protein WC302_02155 [Candidatus Paceibacterota bacterium]|jgi:hypothetical protein